VFSSILVFSIGETMGSFIDEKDVTFGSLIRGSVVVRIAESLCSSRDDDDRSIITEVIIFAIEMISLRYDIDFFDIGFVFFCPFDTAIPHEVLFIIIGSGASSCPILFAFPDQLVAINLFSDDDS
jgi:hypothetical protein